MEKLPFLPLGVQYFAAIRKDNAVYVDKTEYIYKLCLPSNRAYFLSRPRRFGKSLTLDTINELFVGNRSLFKDTWIEDKWDWSQTYPVIRLSLDAISHEGSLNSALKDAIHDIAKKFNIELSKRFAGTLFKELIEKVAEKTEKQVVILIDEYDRPISKYLEPYNHVKIEAPRNTLNRFCSILKSSSNHIRFLLITGVSDFSEIVSPNLNHLTNLSLRSDFAVLCD